MHVSLFSVDVLGRYMNWSVITALEGPLPSNELQVHTNVKKETTTNEMNCIPFILSVHEV